MVMTPADLASAFERNTRIIQAQADGVDHAASLSQSGYNVNCFNWTLGHILVHRDTVLQTLGHDAVMPEGSRERYGHGSEAITADGDDVIAFDRLLDLAADTQTAITKALGDLTEDDMAAEYQAGDRTTTVGRRVAFLYFHDTFHTGQTELLRQMSGKSDAII